MGAISFNPHKMTLNNPHHYILTVHN
jgi:hypothetical protein